jgi:hypothetical protein
VFHQMKFISALPCAPFTACLQVSRLGVCSVLVPTSIGLCLKTFKEGLDKFAAQQQAQ